MAEVVLFHHAQGLTPGIVAFADEGDIDAARALAEEAEDGELFLYPGNQHYFADSSLPSYDAKATALLTERVLRLLSAIAPRQVRARGPPSLRSAAQTRSGSSNVRA